MPTNNAYTPEIVNLQGGLDFVTPKPSVAPGALTDCFNYEVADALGYKRVDGIERFDGRPSISNCYQLLYAATFTSDPAGTMPAIGDALFASGDVTSNAFGIVTAVDGDTPGFAYFYVFDTEKFAAWFVTSTPLEDTSGNSYTLTLGPLYAWHVDENTTNAEAIAGMVDNYTNGAEPTVTQIATLSQGDSNSYSSAIGLQWWNEQLYAIVDFDSIIIEGVSEQLYPGDILDIAGTSQNIQIRDIQIVSGAYSTGDAVLKISFSWLNIGDYNVASKRVTFAPAAVVDVIRGDTTVASIGTVYAISATNSLTSRMAGLFRSWGIDTLPNGSTYQDQGWQELDLGYIMSYGPLAQDTGAPFTSAGRNSQPTPAELTSLVIPPTALVGTPTPAAGGPVLGGLGDNLWHQGAGTVDVLLASPDELTISTAWAQNQAPFSSTTNVIAISGWDFSGLPQDALVSGLEVSVCARHNQTSGAAKIQVTPTSDLLVGANSKQTRIINAVNTSTTFLTTIGTASVTVNNAVNLAVGDTIYILHFNVTPDHRVKATITNIASNVLTIDITEILSGSPGDTMPTNSQVLLVNNLGSSADLWGSQNITVAALQDASFALEVAGTGAAPNQGFLSVDYMYITVWYQETSAVYYFWNGTDDVTGVVTTYTIESGDFATDTAAGTIQVSHVAAGVFSAYGTADRQNIQDGDQIRTLPNGGGNCYGTVTSAALYAGLPSRSALKAAGSQYEFITANFYGNNDWEAIYGCSGAGRAFTYDGFSFRYIFTGLNDTLDLPRHLAFHNFHLCLQYATGAVLSSVTGLPESFDGTLGAAEFDTGDAGTGLLRMNGTTLAIFGRKSIQGLNGTDTTNFSLSILNPYEGAIEYTAVDCGKPVYCSYKGISTFDQTAAYGSFLGNRLSASITPWLLPRLTNTPVPIETDTFSLFGSAYTQGILFAIPIRNKNQYRVYFKDGFCLTLTFQGAEQTPTFTLQQIVFTEDTLPLTLIPFAHSSAVDLNGRDRNHISMYDPINTVFNNLPEYKYVYELDRGWGWGSKPIQAYFTTAHNFFNNPLEFANIRKIRIHGQSKGACTITTSVSKDYGVEDFQYGAGYTIASGPLPVPTARSNAVPQDVSLPRTGFTNYPTTLSFDYQPATNICNVAKLGRTFSMQFVTDPDTIEPPHAAQALMMQINETKGDV